MIVPSLLSKTIFRRDPDLTQRNRGHLNCPTAALERSSQKKSQREHHPPAHDQVTLEIYCYILCKFKCNQVLAHAELPRFA